MSKKRENIRPFFYIENEKGEPVPVNLKLNALWKWKFLASEKKRRVAKSSVSKVKISTVFLGIDTLFGKGKPLLYETMVFGGVYDHYQRKYSSRKEAMKGHKETVKMVKSKTK